MENILKGPRYIYISLIVFGLKLLNVNAQIDYEQIRNTDTISYYVNNPDGDRAEFTWTITGGTIAGHSSPYSAIGADTIKVIWDNSNKSSANIGSLKVSKIINWPGGSSCQSEEEQIYVESWVQPKAITDTSSIIVCSGESFAISIEFEGKPGYRYKWKLYDKENPEILLEDHTVDFINSMDPFKNIAIAGIENSSNTEKFLEFEVIDVQDGFDDNMPGDVSMASVTIYVQPKPKTGILKSPNSIIRR